MRRVLTVALPLLALALAGCPSKPKDGNCESNKDCAAQEGYGKVCVQGKCQECGKNEDCPAGFMCQELKCVPRPECTTDAECPSGKACQAGKCAETAPAVTTPPPAEPAEPVCRVEKVYFDFDDATLRGESRDILARDAECLKTLKASRIRVEGHCDERGTNEYNTHLGQRRAESVKRYLSNLGVDGKSIETVSYGEEQPVCTDATEDCWKQNRRGEIKAQ